MVKDMTFRVKDHMPFYNRNADEGMVAKIEPVYVSPHFDLKTQQLVDPIHLEELIAEVEFN